MNSSVRICTLLIILLCALAQAQAKTQNNTQTQTLAATQLKDGTPEAAPILSMPVAETGEIVKAWLIRSGYHPIQDYRKRDHVVVEAWRGGQLWRITMSAHTALATRIQIMTSGGATSNQIDSLLSYLDEYVNDEPLKKSVPGVAVPQLVKDHLEAVVCIYAIKKEKPIQLSGFCIDRKGLILSTAHGLLIGQTVRVQFIDGHDVKGRVVKLDTQRDLCLVKVPERLPVVIPIESGRFAPDLDEWLFAMGCPKGQSVTITLGVLDGLPKRVEGFPLWQARIHIEPGSSGSPVLDDRGRLTAVVKGRYRGTRAVGFLIPFETLLHFMGKY